MYKKYRVILTDEQRQQLKDLLASGHLPNRAPTHARLLLKADAAGLRDVLLEILRETFGNAIVEHGQVDLVVDAE